MQFAWGIGRETNDVLNAESAARQAIKNGDVDRMAPPSEMSYHATIEFAKQFCRSRQQEFVKRGIDVLDDLRSRFPFVAEILQERALAEIELFDLTKDQIYEQRANDTVAELERVFRGKHPETLARRGRIFKERGDAAFDSDSQALAASVFYRRALDCYQGACQTDDDDAEPYYPLINAATLHLLLGEREASQNLARRVLDELEKPKYASKQKDVWILATRAEALLLQGRLSQSLEYYRQAALVPNTQSHQCESMFKQIQRILRVEPDENNSLEKFAAAMLIPFNE